MQQFPLGRSRTSRLNLHVRSSGSPKRRAWLIPAAIGALMLTLLIPSAVWATTTVSGKYETSEPLEILPDSDPLNQPPIGLTYGKAIAYIKEMPASRTVDQVTVGQVRSSPASCDGTAPSNLRLLVSEYPSDDWAGASNWQVQSTQDRSQPVDFEDLVFPIPRTTFRKGRAYAFMIEATQPWLCTSAELRTWAHNAATVGPGSKRCGRVVENGTSGWRMWHEAGETDAVDCPGGHGIPEYFSPDMPTGWLQVNSWGPGASFVVIHPALSAPPDCGSTFGVHAEWWRFNPIWTSDDDYVCTYTQFGGFGDPQDDDNWYHGAPWQAPGRNGQPRDIHLKLDTIDYDALLDLHAPHLLFDRDDNYRADSPSMHADSPWTTLFNSYGTASGPPWLDDLDATYHGTGQAAESDRLDRYPSGTDAAREQYAYMRSTYPVLYNRTFGRATADSEGRILLQYWLFYFHQEAVDFGPTLAFGEHQGDWELVTVRLDPTTLEPDRAFYAQHGQDGQSCAWENVGHSFTTYNPDVYVAQTTHASYFVSGRSGAHPQDIADGDGDSLVPQVTVIRTDGPSWVSWPGHWGGSADDPAGLTAESPRGPAFQQQWEGHDSWASGLDDACD